MDCDALGCIFKKTPEVGIASSIPGKEGDMQIDDPVGKCLDDIPRKNMPISIGNGEIEVIFPDERKAQRLFFTADAVTKLGQVFLYALAGWSEKEDFHLRIVRHVGLPVVRGDPLPHSAEDDGRALAVHQTACGVCVFRSFLCVCQQLPQGDRGEPGDRKSVV